jgi:hypothetical protein
MRTNIMTLVFLIFAIFVVGYSLTFTPDARFGPMVIGIPLIVLLIIQVVVEKRSKKATSPEEATANDDGPSEHSKISGRTVLEIAVALAGLVAVVYVFGMVLGFAIFIFVYLKLRGERWLTTIALAVAVPAFIYGLFQVTLKMNIYKGILLPLLWQ